MAYNWMKTSRDRAYVLKCIALALLLALLVIPQLICFFHGYKLDVIGNGLHKDCTMCKIYRFMHQNDNAFQLRELNRSAKNR